jgi:hypothetical protein
LESRFRSNKVATFPVPGIVRFALVVDTPRLRFLAGVSACHRINSIHRIQSTPSLAHRDHKRFAGYVGPPIGTDRGARWPNHAPNEGGRSCCKLSGSLPAASFVLSSGLHRQFTIGNSRSRCTARYAVYSVRPCFFCLSTLPSKTARGIGASAPASRALVGLPSVPASQSDRNQTSVWTLFAYHPTPMLLVRFARNACRASLARRGMRALQK